MRLAEGGGGWLSEGVAGGAKVGRVRVWLAESCVVGWVRVWLVESGCGRLSQGRQSECVAG